MSTRPEPSPTPPGPALGSPSPLPTVFDSEEQQQAARRLLLFMGTRLGVATLLLGSTLWLALENTHGTDSFTPRFLMALIAAIYGGSLASSVWLLRRRDHARVATLQVGLDLVLTTGLVYITGGAGSGFSFLYGVAVLMAAMVLGPTPARVAGILALAMYTALIAGLSFGKLPPPADQAVDAYQMPASELAYAWLLNVFGLLLVTLLAGSLAARVWSAGGRLRLAEASAASLARLNEDIVRSLNSGLVTTDLNGRIRSINPAGLEILRAEFQGLLGEAVERHLPIEAFQSALRDGVVRAEGNARGADGGTFPVGFSLNALNNLDGTSIGALILFQDLSEIVALRETAARGERLAVLGRLSAGLAHEIRNPLGSISGSVQLVKDSARLNQEDRNLLGIVLREVERLDDLVSTMLLVGRPREPMRKPCDLRQLADDVVEITRRGPAADGDIDIDVVRGDLPVMAWADEDQIRQVMWNLLKNALQASPRGTVVRVGASVRAGFAVLEVSDQGRGIDHGQRTKIYDMFYSERTHGAGIGLALVRQIVDAHQGKIEIISEQSRGATFVVSLPMAPRASDPAKLSGHELHERTTIH
ncbi:MAG TPA: ATP-binding protein [Polyangiales bacterium]|nr:ATP-binding protein [Polyangiales bacterium]